MKTNTVTWSVWMLAALLICSLTYNPAYLALALLTLIALARRLEFSAKPCIKAGILFGIPLLVINLLFIHTGERVITTIPSRVLGMPLPLISGAITLESVYAGAIFILLMTDMLLAFAVYQNQTTPDAVIRLIPRQLSHSALLTAISLRFIPTLALDAQSVSEANRSRGQKTKNTSLAKKIRNRASLIMPTLVNSLERSYNLAESLESRGYTSNRTKYSAETWTKKDKALTLLYLTAAALTIGLAISERLGPTSFPDIENMLALSKPNPLVIASIISLILPGERK